MLNKILTIIAMNSPYSPMELKKLYEQVKSIDLVICVINIAERLNVPLEIAAHEVTFSNVIRKYDE